MDLVELIIGNFIGFGLALLVYMISQLFLNNKEKNYERIKQNNFLRLILDEIIYNKKAIELLLKKDESNTSTLLRLQTFNKDSCWSRIIEFRYNNLELIQEISLAYSLFIAVNDLLNYEPYYVEDEKNFNIFCEERMQSIKDICTDKHGCLDSIDIVLNLIDMELQKN